MTLRTICLLAPKLCGVHYLTLNVYSCSKQWLEYYTHDILQSLVQSNTVVQRRVYVLPRSVLGLPARIVLNIIGLLYGLPKSNLQSYAMCQDHRQENIRHQPAVHGPWAPFTKRSSVLNYKQSRDSTGILTDDTVHTRNKEFVKSEDSLYKRFESEAKMVLNNCRKLTFNGSHVKKN